MSLFCKNKIYILEQETLALWLRDTTLKGGVQLTVCLRTKFSRSLCSPSHQCVCDFKYKAQVIQTGFWTWLNIEEHASYQNNYQEATGKDSLVSGDCNNGLTWRGGADT